jgi:hypothetical protein
MDLMQIIQQMLQQREIEEQKRREALARRLNERAFRNRQGPNMGNPIEQGDGGVYSDSMPFTIEDYFRTQKPGFNGFMNRQNPVAPQPETSLRPQNPYQGLMI